MSTTSTFFHFYKNRKISISAHVYCSSTFIFLLSVATSLGKKSIGYLYHFLCKYVKYNFFPILGGVANDKNYELSAPIKTKLYISGP